MVAKKSRRGTDGICSVDSEEIASVMPQKFPCYLGIQMIALPYSSLHRQLYLVLSPTAITEKFIC